MMEIREFLDGHFSDLTIEPQPQLNDFDGFRRSTDIEQLEGLMFLKLVWKNFMSVKTNINKNF